MTNLISLTTDFGLADGFVGIMKGVMLSINPEARFVDITHEIPPQDIQQGAFHLATSIPYFPADAIHLCVVDPGVGSERRAIAVQVGKSTLVGPDNGVLSLAVDALRQQSGAEPRAFELNNPRYWLERVSSTFHGRDIFSPSAAYLSRGVPLTELGTPVADYVTLAPSAPSRHEDGSIAGHIIHIDRYGNIVSDIQASLLEHLAPDHIVVSIGGRKIHGLARTYSDVEPGEFAALVGSPWRLEVARRNGDAAEALGVGVGDPIVVHVKSE